MMRTLQLAERIHSLRNTDVPSQVILPRDPAAADTPEPIGVLLLKPSSGSIPLATVHEILRRLVDGHGYRIQAAAWWSGADMKRSGLMSLHYPGFHRVAHGGLAGLSPEARARLRALYSDNSAGQAFGAAFGLAFDSNLVQTPFDLVQQGLSPEKLNRIWELDRSKEPLPLKTIQRLDEDSFALGLRLPAEDEPPIALRERVFVLLNGFYAKLQKDFEAKGCVALLIQKGPASLTSWEELRSKFAGKTNPFQAPPGTVRGDAARGVLEVETISILANVIHLSGNEAEGRREVEQVWWEPKLFSKTFTAPPFLV